MKSRLVLARALLPRLHLGSLLLSNLLLAGVSCATNPATGKRELVLVSEAQEIEMGRAAAGEVRESLGLYEDRSLAAYVSEMGLRLARSSERPNLPWEIHVVDSPVVNAFALPGGFIYLTRGILAHMNSEAAMVGVLGHEIGHVTARHSVQQISRAQLAGLGLGLGVIFVPEVRPFGDLLESGLGLLFLKFSRDDEREADSLGVRYAFAAGYDPVPMARFFEVMGRMGQGSRGGLPSWLSTHPEPEDRQRRILELVRAAPAGRDLAVREEIFKREIEGLVYGEDPRQGFMDGARFKHPALRFQLDFPPGWNVENTRQAVYAASPEKDAAIQLTASRVRPGTRPEEHAIRFFRQNQLDFGSGQRLSISGFSAYRAPFGTRSRAVPLGGEAGFVVDAETAYEILGYTHRNLLGRHRRKFLAVIESFSRLTDPEALRVEPKRIALHRVPRSMTAAEALGRAETEEKPADLALLNNLRLEDKIEAGSLLKIVMRGQR